MQARKRNDRRGYYAGDGHRWCAPKGMGAAFSAATMFRICYDCRVDVEKLWISSSRRLARSVASGRAGVFQRRVQYPRLKPARVLGPAFSLTASISLNWPTRSAFGPGSSTKREDRPCGAPILPHTASVSATVSWLPGPPASMRPAIQPEPGTGPGSEVSLILYNTYGILWYTSLVRAGPRFPGKVAVGRGFGSTV